MTQPRKLTRPQITKILKAAGINFLPEVPQGEPRTNCFWFEGRNLVVSTDWTKGRALSALDKTGRGFGGFRCGWGGWVIREDYSMDYSTQLAHENRD